MTEMHPPLPRLQTERLTLRVPDARDVTPWADFLMSERGFWKGVGPQQEPGRAWRSAVMMIGHWQVHGFGMFTLEDKTSGTAIGSVGLYFPGDWPEREIGWAIWDTANEGKGYAREAARAVISYAFSDLGWNTLVSYIDARNAPSIALAERLGARRDDAAERPARVDLVYRHPKAEAA